MAKEILTFGEVEIAKKTNFTTIGDGRCRY